MNCLNHACNGSVFTYTKSSRGTCAWSLASVNHQRASVASEGRSVLRLEHQQALNAHIIRKSRRLGNIMPVSRQSSAGRTADDEQDQRSKRRDRKYSLATGFPFPLGPFSERQTLRTKLMPGMWAFEQPQNLAGSNVHTNIRMTAIELSSGGLLIYAPIAPTRECVALVKELGMSVEHILLPTFAYEHKIFVGPFSRKFPDAQVYVAPGQWSFPLRLPLPLLGINRSIDIVEGETYPWSADLDHRVLSINISKGVGPYVEVAAFHRSSKTLLLVDSAVSVPQKPPPIIPQWALQDAGGSSFFVRLLYGDVSDQQAERQEAAAAKGPAAQAAATELLGWQRMCLQVLFFAPVNLLSPQQSFARFADRLIVSPVVRVLVFSKTPREVAIWIEDIASSWNFRQIVPCHLAAPIPSTPSDLRKAFAWAYKSADMKAPKQASSLFSRLQSAVAGISRGGARRKDAGEDEDLFDSEDLKALQTLSQTLNKAGVTVDDSAS